MQKLSEEERGAIEMWLKGLETGASDFYSNTKDADVRVYQDGQALAYGDMRVIVRDERNIMDKMVAYVAEQERYLKKAWSEEEAIRCRGRLAAAKHVYEVLKVY